MNLYVLCAIGLLSLAHGANILFEAATVLSFDNMTQRVLPLFNTSLLVVNDRIESIFPASETIPLPEGTERIPSQGKIITPGFVDTHRHLWQAALRTLGSNTTLAEYFLRFSEFSAQSATYTPEDVYLGQLVGIWESLEAGTTSILDHAHHTWSPEFSSAGLNATVEGGARVWWCYAFHELANGFSLEDQFADFQRLADANAFNGSSSSLGLSWDGWSTSSRELNERVIELARNNNISAFTTHYLGGPWSYGNSPQLVHSYDFLNDSIPIVFSHASFLTPDDAILLRSTNQYYSITPESEEHYGQDHPHNHLAQDQAALGVDTHFTFSADMLTQARIWMQSVRFLLFHDVLEQWNIAQNNPMSVEQSFLLATRSGGLALRRPDVGVLVPGAKADIVVFDTSRVHHWGWSNPVAAVMLHANPGDIEHVLVDGEFRKRDFQLTVDPDRLQDVRTRFLEGAMRIQAADAERGPVEYPDTYANGLPYGRTTNVDVVRGESNGYEASTGPARGDEL